MPARPFADLIQTPAYSFLRTNSHLGENLLFLGLGGSHAYGMSVPGSDVDIRGVALNSKEEILLGRDFSQVVDTPTDTTVYSLRRLVELLCSNNPNTLELLGLADNQIVFVSERYARFYKELKELAPAFLSRQVVRTFGGYATTQLRRLENKAVRDLSEGRREEHILQSLNFADEDLRRKFPEAAGSSIRLYVDRSANPDRECEIFIDAAVTHCPLRGFAGMINGYGCVVRDYDKLNAGRRTREAMERKKLAKHSAHLVRLYYMAFDILEGRGVITYREKEHDLLMSIRSGEWLDGESQPTKAFYELVDRLEARLMELARVTTLPEEPDYERIYAWLASVNEAVVTGAGL